MPTDQLHHGIADPMVSAGPPATALIKMSARPLPHRLIGCGSEDQLWPGSVLVTEMAPIYLALVYAGCPQ
jgi:hypothetical protein